MDIVGICRFSLLGRGDWKAYQGQPEDQIERIAMEQAERLFAPERMEHRLATFEHITLASLQSQTDQGFHFAVLASDFMPSRYREDLIRICEKTPQITLRFFPLSGAGAAQKQVFTELGLSYGNTLQFRLDDDDAVSSNYIERMRRFCEPLAKHKLNFAASFQKVAFCNTSDGTGFMRDMPFMSAGAALLHRKHSIFSYGHFSLQRRFTSVIIPSCSSLISRHETNDSPGKKGRREKRPMNVEQMAAHIGAQFPFLSAQGRGLLGQTLQVEHVEVGA